MTISHYINGQTVRSPNSRTQDVFNPATGEVTAQVALADVADVNAAVAAAKAAFPSTARRLGCPLLTERPAGARAQASAGADAGAGAGASARVGAGAGGHAGAGAEVSMWKVSFRI